MWKFNRTKPMEGINTIARSDIEQTVATFVSTLADTSQPVYVGTWKMFTDWFDRQYPGRCLTRLSTLEAQVFMKFYSGRPGQSSRIGGNPTLSPTTLKKISATLAALYRAILDEHKLEIRNPWRAVFETYRGAKSKVRRPTELTPFDKVLELVRSPGFDTPVGMRDAAVLALLYGGALRRSEVAKLRFGEVFVHGRSRVSIYLRQTKNGDDDEQLLPPWAAEIIEKVYRQRSKEGARPMDALLIDYSGKYQRKTTRGISESSVYKIHKRWCAHVGLPSTISTHSGRATAITQLLEKGVSHREVRVFSRHRSVNMVEWYDKLRNDSRLNPASLLTFEEAETGSNNDDEA